MLTRLRRRRRYIAVGWDYPQMVDLSTGEQRECYSRRQARKMAALWNSKEVSRTLRLQRDSRLLDETVAALLQFYPLPWVVSQFDAAVIAGNGQTVLEASSDEPAKELVTRAMATVGALPVESPQ